MDPIEHPAQLVLRNAREHADQIWLRQPGQEGPERTWTYSQAAVEIGRMAAALREMGLEPGAKVAISGRNTAHFLMADYAISLAGFVSVGLYPKQSAAHITYILSHSEAAALFVGPMPDMEEFMAAVPDGIRTIGLPYPGVPECETTWDGLIDGREPVIEYSPPPDDELMTLIYTSGSTGDPKGVMITYDRLQLMTSIPIIRRLVRRKILEGAGLQNVTTCISGSAPLPIPVLEWFDQALGIQILQGYSLSETTLYATANLPEANRLGSVGRPLPGCEVRIADDGEIQLRHGAVMPGYYKSPEKTAEALTEDGFLRTGDKGKVDEDGYVWITGRTKEIFKTLKGKYVAPAPIEGAMRRNGALGPVCLVGAGLNQPILLATLGEEGQEAARADVEKSLTQTMNEVNETLEPHEKIAKIVVLKDEWTIDNGLLTPTLKVKANVVEERFAELITAEAAVRGDIAWQA